MHRRVRGLLEHHHLTSAAELIHHLETDETTWGPRVAAAMAIHHTAFFRERTTLSRLDKDVFPDLGQKKGQHRIWCCAVSTGEEAYTLAMLLAERFGPTTARERFAILGTDLVESVLQRAELGRYSAREISGLEVQRKQRWLTPLARGQFELNRELRAMCTFRRLNLNSPEWPFRKRFSLVLCRNVLYYFDRRTQRQLLTRLHACVENEGHLVTGVSESVRDLSTPWRTIAAGLHIKEATTSHPLPSKPDIVPSSSSRARHKAAPLRQPVTATVSTPTQRPVVVIGASTGGVEALVWLVRELPPSFPGGVVVIHIADDYLLPLAQRLNASGTLTVELAGPRTRLKPGTLLLAPGGGQHLLIERWGSELRTRIQTGTNMELHVPSVDALFSTTARAAGPSAIGVLLTGMGADGAFGLLEIQQMGGHTIVQDEATSVVFGMPRAAIALGAADQGTPLPNIARAISEACRKVRAAISQGNPRRETTLETAETT